MKKLALSLALAGCLAGCAAQQQAAIPPSPTGCYIVNRGLITAAIRGRYEPAPCNVVNARRPVVVGPSDGGMASVGSGGASAGETVIRSSDCIGAVVMGVCHGAPAPMAPMATCHGQMLGGACTGPMF
jgi:hypothetical protein